MKAQDYFNRLPEDFNTQVLNVSETMGMDGAIYFMIGRNLPEIDDNDDELLDELIELIIEKWSELEF